MDFKLASPFQPTGDQPAAIDALTKGVTAGLPDQVLLGVTGSGKTFTMANIIERVQKPTLIIAHNKTLAAQLYQEFRDFFPQNAVSYFVSYYDYYQPEAYIPSSDTYIEKDSSINDEIDKLRLASTTNLLTRKDVIVVASVSCIYNLGSPVEYGRYILRLVPGEVIARKTVLLQLANLQYERSEAELFRGSYRLRGDTIQVWPAYEDRALRIETLENQIETITWIDPISGSPISPVNSHRPLEGADQQGDPEAYQNPEFIIYPAKHYMLDPKSQQDQIAAIRADLEMQVASLTAAGKPLEAYRLRQKVEYDLEMITELGFVNGIENYSRYFDGREPGDPPFTLLDYFAENSRTFQTNGFLTFVDESHMTLPQIRGMFNGDQARKQTLVEYGFRLPSALDNRPLRFEEFLERTPQSIHVSATPADFEISRANGQIVEQLIRPTGLLDPTIELRQTEGQIEDLVIEILNRTAIGQRTLVTTLTKKMAEALTDYLNDHQKITTLINRFRERIHAQQLAVESDADASSWRGTASAGHRVWQGDPLPIDDFEIGPIPTQYLTQATVGDQLQTVIDEALVAVTPSAKKSPSSSDGTSASAQLSSAALKVLRDQLHFPKVAYLHSDIDTLERSDILDDLRRGTYDVLVGINLLREGLDLPEVTLVAILDADKEGFLRSTTSMIQTMGRAARHNQGHAILYADRLTQSMQKAISETLRRRSKQMAFNQAHGIEATTISKPIRERMIKKLADADTESAGKRPGKGRGRNQSNRSQRPGSTKQEQERHPDQVPSNSVIELSKQESLDLATFDPASLTPHEKKQYTKKLTTKMKRAADTMDYELAALLRDLITDINKHDG